MFDPTSRYFKTAIATLSRKSPDGTSRDIAYLRRRFIPSPQGMTTLLEHTVTEGDRLDNVTARYLGDATRFWQVCDANAALRPSDLTGEDSIGHPIRIAMSLA